MRKNTQATKNIHTYSLDTRGIQKHRFLSKFAHFSHKSDNNVRNEGRIDVHFG